ncbi:Cutinase [Akanthomyces lecanii RCEF 1005]|uniref:cutinase n=1 Tax=Akanthomyces lecanii RCEF 1005 TaxID=1081108 RepID=A0A168HBU4_CORDF|nr:Cutinase [Akanthomyces lecanii RCEF 1005]
MHNFLALTSVLALSTTAQASSSPLACHPSNDVANDWDKPSCAELAVIFARGTFDSGNIGPWVGPAFRKALYSEVGDKLAFQGVSPQDYPANLEGIMEEGGSESCAVSLGEAVERYSARCPDAKIIISGWSQGALCAHKSFNASKALVNEQARKQVIALTTFGDPVPVWSDSIKLPTLPRNVQLLTYCATSNPDPFCTDKPLQDWPHDPTAFGEKLEAVWHDYDFGAAGLSDTQKKAANDLIMALPSLIESKIGQLGKDIAAGHIRRWMLTPQHFMYGSGPHPMTEQAARDVARLFQQSK